MQTRQTLKMTYAAVFAVLIFAGTQLMRVPLPFGYFNMGDCFVLLAAWIVGGRYAMAAAAVGPVLADVLSGYTIYVPATLIIKPLMVWIMMTIAAMGRHRGEGMRPLFVAIGAVAAEILMVSGYFLYDCLLYGMAGAAISLPGNLMQGAAAVVMSLCIVTVLEHGGVMKYIKVW